MAPRTRLHAFLAPLALVALVGLAACGGSQVVQYGPGFSEMTVSDDWVPAPKKGDVMRFTLDGEPGVELRIRGGADSLGSGAVTSQALKALYGRELNLKHGGVKAMMTYEGNALLHYQGELPEPGGEGYAWLLAAPGAVGTALRLEVSLAVPEGQMDAPETRERVEELERSLSEARFLSWDA